MRPAEGAPELAVEEAGAGGDAAAGEAAFSEEPAAAAAEESGSPAAKRHHLPDGTTPQKPKDGDDEGCPWEDINKKDNLDAKACGDKGGDADRLASSGTKSKNAKSRKKGTPAGDEEPTAAQGGPAVARPGAADAAGAAVGPQAKAKANARGDRGGDADAAGSAVGPRAKPKAKAKACGDAEALGAKSGSAKSRKDSKKSEPGSVGELLRAGARPKTQGPGAQVAHGGQGAAAQFEDPDVMGLLHQANSVWDDRKEGRKKSEVLYKLAGRKGYSPSYALLAQRAIRAEDFPLAVEAFCSLLGHKDARIQCTDSMLSSCADQLAEILRDPAHADLLTERLPELERFQKTWPALQVLLVLAAVRQGGGGGAASALQDLAGKKAHSRALIEEIESTTASSSGASSSTLASSSSSARPTGTPTPPIIEIFEENGERMTSTSDSPAMLREKLRRKGMRSAEELQSGSAPPSSLGGAAQTGGGAELPAEEGSKANREAAPGPRAGDERGEGEAEKLEAEDVREVVDAGARQWSEDAGGWRLTAEVPGLARLADASLDVSDAEVCLLGTGGACLLRERLPLGAGACAAERASVRWSQRRRCLTLTLPRRAASDRAVAAVDQLD